MIYLLFLSLSSRLIYGENPSESGGGSVSYSYNVMVNMAENLADEDPDAPTIFGWQAWTNKNDPYVQIYAYGTGDEDALKVKTTTILEGTETPQWDETFVFDDDDTVGPYTKFLFKVWDNDSTFDKDGSFDWLNINDPDFLGETRQILIDQITNCVNDFEFVLPVIRDNNECGLLVVEITKNGCTSAADSATGSEKEDTTLSECNSTLSNVEMILGGQYFNTSVNIIESINMTDTSCSYWIINQKTVYSEVYNWAAGKTYPSYNSTGQHLIDLSTNLHAINELINGRNLTNDSNTEILAYGNLILCNLTICPIKDFPRIGPSTSILFLQYRPVAINTDFNLSRIIHTPLIEDKYSDKISILCYFYAIHKNDTSLSTVFENELFPDGTIGNYQSTNSKYSNGIITTSGIVAATYTDIEKLREYVGDPSRWNVSFNEFFWESEETSNVIIYLYGISALCSNKKICDRYLYPTSSWFLRKWQIIAGVFMVVFVASLGIMAYLLYKLGMCNEKTRKGGHDESHEAVDVIPNNNNSII